LIDSVGIHKQASLCETKAKAQIFPTNLGFRQNISGGGIEVLFSRAYI